MSNCIAFGKLNQWPNLLQLDDQLVWCVIFILRLEEL